MPSPRRLDACLTTTELAAFLGITPAPSDRSSAATASRPHAPAEASTSFGRRPWSSPPPASTTGERGRNFLSMTEPTSPPFDPVVAMTMWMIAAVANAGQLLNDAATLAEAGSTRRAFALAILSKEELGKANILRDELRSTTDDTRATYGCDRRVVGCRGPPVRDNGSCVG